MGLEVVQEGAARIGEAWVFGQRQLSGGIEATALQFPKRFFGSARNI